MEANSWHPPDEEDVLTLSAASSLTLLTNAKAFSLKELHTVARQNLIASTQESIARQLWACSEDVSFQEEALLGKQTPQLSLWPDDDLFLFDAGAASDAVSEVEQHNCTNRGNVDGIRPGHGTAPVALAPTTDGAVSVTCAPDEAKGDGAGPPLGVEAERGRGRKPLACKEPGCGRTFRWRAHLRYHQQTHRGGRCHTCSVAGCGRSFMTAQQLQVHGRVHTGERPFKCEHCEATFTTAGNLRNHHRSKHTGERPFACVEEGCQKKFAELSSLKKHRLVHTELCREHTMPPCRIGGRLWKRLSSRPAPGTEVVTILKSTFWTLLLLFVVVTTARMCTQITDVRQVDDLQPPDPVPVLQMEPFPLEQVLISPVLDAAKVKTSCAAGEVEVLFAVHSDPDHASRRALYRRTSFRLLLRLKFRWAVVFFVGLRDNDTNDKLSREADHHGDVVQLPFKDAYLNLTYKLIYGMRWILGRCPQAKQVAKIDDDIFFYPDAVRALLKKYDGLRDSFICRSIQPEVIRKYLRKNKGSKDIHVTVAASLNLDEVGSYCHGFAVFFATAMIEPILKAAHYVPYCAADDAYVSGTLRRVLGFRLEETERHRFPLPWSRNNKDSIMDVIHPYDAGHFMRAWKVASKRL